VIAAAQHQLRPLPAALASIRAGINAPPVVITPAASGAAPNFAYSRGRDRYDNKPQQRSAPTWPAFVEAIWSDRSAEKGNTYICAPFVEGMHNNPTKYPGVAPYRQKHLAGRRNWLPGDVDGLADGEAFAELRKFLNTYDALLYTTDSSTADSPRCRYIVRTSRLMKYEETIIVGEQVQREIVAAIGADRIKFDSSVLRGEQPCYLPTVRAERFDTHGVALDVDAMLAHAKVVQAELQAATKPKNTAFSETKPRTSSAQVRADAIAEADPVFRRLDERGLLKSQAGPGIFNVQCPCGAEHTTESTETSCQYRLPNFAGVRYGKFVCQHAHCRDREQQEFIEAVGLNPTEVWAEQRGEVRKDPLDDFSDLTAGAEGGDVGGGHPGGGNATDVDLARWVVSLDGVDDMFEEAAPTVINSIVPVDEITLFVGHGGVGKTYVAMGMAVDVALGRPIGPLPTTPVRVLVFSAEDDRRVLRRRLARLCRQRGIDPAMLKDKLFLVDASDLDPALYRAQPVGRAGATETRLLNALAALVQELDIGLVIIDGASDTFDGDEIRRREVRAFIRSLRKRIARPGRAVILLAHINKISARNKDSTEAYSGSTAWHNSVRSRLSLEDDGAGGLVLRHLKSNLGPLVTPIQFAWVHGVPTVITDVGVQAPETTSAPAEKDAIVRVIKDFDQRGELVTTSIHGASTVFKTLKDHKHFPPGVEAARLTRLLRELEAEGRVLRQTIRTASRKLRDVFTCRAAPTPAPASVSATVASMAVAAPNAAPVGSP
jgi:hypothetical protein